MVYLGDKIIQRVQIGAEIAMPCEGAGKAAPVFCACSNPASVPKATDSYGLQEFHIDPILKGGGARDAYH